MLLETKSIIHLAIAPTILLTKANPALVTIIHSQRRISVVKLYQ